MDACTHWRHCVIRLGPTPRPQDRVNLDQFFLLAHRRLRIRPFTTTTTFSRHRRMSMSKLLLSVAATRRVLATLVNTWHC